MFTNKLIQLLILSTCFTTLQAQNYVDLLKIDYSTSKGNNFKEESGSSDVKEWVIDATVPIVLSDNTTLLTGFVFENVVMTPYPEQDSESVFTLNLKMGLNKIYSEKWSATYLLLPKISSDLEEVAKADLQLGLVALFKLTKNDQFNLKFGAYYNTDLFGPFLVPFVGFYYQKGQWESNVLLPATVDINYQVFERLKAGLRFNGFIKSFNLNDDLLGSEYLTKSNNEIGFYLGTALGKVNIIGMVGRSIGRNYRTYASGDQMNFALSAIKIGDNRNQLNSDFEDGLVFKTSLIYRLMIDSEK